MKVAILSPYRTGSTVAFQIVKELLGYAPSKYHNTDAEFDLCVLCIRDPYYSISSMFRLNIGEMDGLIDHHFQWASFYINNKDKKEILVIRYENYIKDPIARIKKIADFLSIQLTEDRILEIQNKTSIESNTKISETLKAFDVWSEETCIHGNHIGSPYNKFKHSFTSAESSKIEDIRKRMGYKRK